MISKLVSLEWKVDERREGKFDCWLTKMSLPSKRPGWMEDIQTYPKPEDAKLRNKDSRLRQPSQSSSKHFLGRHRENRILNVSQLYWRNDKAVPKEQVSGQGLGELGISL